MYAEKLSVIETRLQSLEAEINKTSVETTEAETVLGIFKKYKNITKLSRNVIVELIDCIWVYENNEVKIRFKYQNIFEKISMLIKESRQNVLIDTDDETVQVKAVNS